MMPPGPFCSKWCLNYGPMEPSCCFVSVSGWGALRGTKGTGQPLHNWLHLGYLRSLFHTLEMQVRVETIRFFPSPTCPTLVLCERT